MEGIAVFLHRNQKRIHISLRLQKVRPKNKTKIKNKDKSNKNKQKQKKKQAEEKKHSPLQIWVSMQSLTYPQVLCTPSQTFWGESFSNRKWHQVVESKQTGNMQLLIVWLFPRWPAGRWSLLVYLSTTKRPNAWQSWISAHLWCLCLHWCPNNPKANPTNTQHRVFCFYEKIIRYEEVFMHKKHKVRNTITSR